MGSEDGLMSGNEERIYVSVRLRPLNENEIFRNDVADWECINDKTIVFKNAGLSASEKSMYPTAYTFDRVFRSECSTKQVYENGARHIAVSVVNGINSSVFAYGQTSSGKTYTMTGLTEFALADIYDCIKRLPEREFVLKFSAMEIYNESVRDLLSVDTTPLRLLDDPTRGTIVEKLTEEILKDWDHVVHLLSICEAQRQIGETSLNEMSSRSHQIIRLTIESSSRDFLGRGSATTLTATMNFVDLAGSERASQSLSAGTRLKEGCHINRSLLTLGTVIRKLSKSRSGHIPYRDSKLTRILQTSLGGNAKTAIICTMSPARSHVEQSRNTLLFASCAKEVTTSARVNVVMSDKALVKYLQREIVRLETELRSPRSSFTPSDYSAVLREKDRQIDKLEEEINDLILQRDIAQSQVKDLLRILGNDTDRPLQVGYGNYPHLRVHESPENDLRSSILSDSQSVEINTRVYSGGHSRSSSLGHIVKVPYFECNFANAIESPRIFTSTPSERYSYHRWEDIEKRSSPTSEDLCREVQCIEIRESSEKSVTKENTEVDVSEDEQNLEFRLSPTFDKDQILRTTRLESRDEIMKNSNESQENESSCDKEKENRSTARFPTKKSFENPSLSIPERAIDQPISRALRLTKSRSCKANITESNSPLLKTNNFIENSLFFDPGRESSGFKRNLSPLSSEMAAKTVSRKDSQSSPGNALDSEIDSPIVKFPNPQVLGSTNGEVDTNELSVKHIFVKNQSEEITPKTGEDAKKNVKDVGLDPIEYEPKDPSTWPTEFKRLQREIIELWHECHVSLIHRAYFFVLFRGDSSDAIYLEMEMRRLKFLKQRFSLGEKTTMNGKCLTLSSSEKALGEERRMLSQRMMRKLSEQERESLFVKWSIGLNTKLRRLQLANRLWTKTDDMDHVSDSAYLVAKLVGTVEPGHTHNKEMFGLNLTPRSSTRTYSLKRSLISFL